MAARAVAAARHALSRAQPQAGVADRVGGVAPQPEWHAPGWFVGRPDGRVIVALPGPRARCARCGPTRPCPASRRSAWERRWPAGRIAWPGSASRRSPSCSARRCSGRPIRSSRRTPGSRRSTSGFGRRGRDDVGRGAGRDRRPAVVEAKLGDYVWATARRPGATRSGPASVSSAGRLRWSRSAPAGASRRCSATRLAALRQIDRRRGPGRDRPRARARAARPAPDDATDEAAPTTSGAMRGGPASSVGRTSAWPSGPVRAAATWRCRSRSCPVRGAPCRARGVPGRWDGTLAGGPRRGCLPARGPRRDPA